ncbi:MULTISPECIES: hypothetical protein [unclassified Paenibacillus]|uniref:hypothetical protein n=1 Tax=unclassified Paenibacillus TaxID=185978 RepID=UPI002F405A6D
MGNYWQAKRKGNEEQDWEWRSGSAAFVGQFNPLQGLFHQKNWTITAVGIPNLIVVTSLSIAY